MKTFLVAAAAVLALSGCGGGTTDEPAKPDKPEVPELTYGTMCDVRVDDPALAKVLASADKDNELVGKKKGERFTDCALPVGLNRPVGLVTGIRETTAAGWKRQVAKMASGNGGALECAPINDWDELVAGAQIVSCNSGAGGPFHVLAVMASGFFGDKDLACSVQQIGEHELGSAQDKAQMTKLVDQAKELCIATRDHRSK